MSAMVKHIGLANLHLQWEMLFWNDSYQGCKVLTTKPAQFYSKQSQNFPSRILKGKKHIPLVKFEFCIMNFQYHVSHDPSENIIIFWLSAQEPIILLSMLTLRIKPHYKSWHCIFPPTCGNVSSFRKQNYLTQSVSAVFCTMCSSSPGSN